ncbi:MAG: hypothetical protein WBJ83_08345 [Thermacetogeniaceae bacterium]|nr:hypothetical protein [Syntrophomonadaceae bacterium]
MKQIRFITVICSLILTLCVLFGGYYLYDRYFIRDGLREQISQLVTAQEINIEKQDNSSVVSIRSAEIDDFQSVYQKTAKLVYQSLGPQAEIVFLDERTENLSMLYEECNFIIHEGIATGKFQDMRTQVLNLADQEGVQCDLSIDSSNIYLVLKDDQGYLYEVIPRIKQLDGWEKLGGDMVD